MQIMRCALSFLPVLAFAQANVSRHLDDPEQLAGASIDRVLDKHIAHQDGCEPLMIGHGPVPVPDTPEEFQNFTTLYATARIAPTPLGYRPIGQALNASVWGKVFRGVEYLTEYNPALCAKECNANEDCSSFNICVWLLRLARPRQFLG